VSSERIASTRQQEALPCKVFGHQTPIYRQLKNVEMWLQENKGINLSLAIKQFEGLLLMPGETFSFWRILGKPSRRKGYRAGMVLSGGQFRSGTGGGLCQLSNLIFWMVLHTPLKVSERYRHSFDVFPDEKRRLPFGSGATCVYNYRDLVFHNTTNETFQFHFWIEEGNLCGEILSMRPPLFQYEIIEKNHRMYPGGFAYVRENELYRQTYEEGECIDESFLFSNQAWMMYEPFIEGGKELERVYSIAESR
jgi:vancomycin resistance protein VanW